MLVLFLSEEGFTKAWSSIALWPLTLEADLHPLNHRLNSAWRLAQDREWQLVETAMLQTGAHPRWWWWWWSRIASIKVYISM